MRVVHLTTEFPWPAIDGGRIRTLSQLRALASLPEVERIALLSVSEREVTGAQCAALAEAVPGVTVLPPVFHPIHLRRHPGYVPRVLALRAHGVPYVIAKWDSRVLRRVLRDQLRESAVDVVYVDHLGMARYLPDIRAERPLSRVVLDQHNVESELFRQFAERRRALGRVVAQAEWRAAARVEKHILESVDAVVAISGADAETFWRLAHVRAHVVPVGVEVGRRRHWDVDRPQFCYAGSLQWQPNVLGLAWFCQSVWPKIRRRVVDATFEIAGVGLERSRGGQLRVPDAWKGAGIVTRGFVRDVEALYSRSLAMLVPVLGGSGVRIKVLEGLRAGLPIVTTPDGVFGLPLTDAKELLAARDADAFAERVERLVRHEGLRARLRAEGYAYLEKCHSMAVVRSTLRAALGLDSPS